ncbi:hypothetical protein ONA70_05700 [Micromonospora yasonensis]|uniref:hypothetical protein n=1 Tax=Micromonospora yasonensis TaxID=1128667 RepID=UPI0022327024|nr:hypothetical protein [Micromonospora yasonensis]MCW3839586.1 hypothetical protein [Micromonospora yasonensis]
MSLRLIHLVCCRIAGWQFLLAGCNAAKNVELLVLRYEKEACADKPCPCRKRHPP